MPSVQNIRTALADYIEGQARWRAEKANEYPEDGRNATSAAALRELRDYVTALPDTDARLAALADLDGLTPDDVLMPGEEAARMVSRHGFDRPRLHVDPSWRPESESEFLDAFVDTCRQEAKALGIESLQEAAMSEGALEALDELDREAHDA